MKLYWPILVLALSGCSGMNPNPGERTADTNWEQGNPERALEVARSAAERGMPWAQLRMGIYYNTGFGVEEDIPEAIKWYKLAARQLEEGKWAEGYMVGATGETGYFGQKSDALIAQYRLADIYYQGEGVGKDLTLSYLLINNVITKSHGDPDVFFCCDWSGGRWFHETQFTELKANLEKAMTQEQLEEAVIMSKSWDLKTDL